MRRGMAILAGMIAVALIIGIAGTAYAFRMEPFSGAYGRGYMNGPMNSGCRLHGNGQSPNGYPPQNATVSQSGRCCGPNSYQPQNATADDAVDTTTSYYGRCCRRHGHCCRP